MPGRVCVLGSLNLDLVTRVATHPSPGETVLGRGLARLPGGKGANQALAAARAGARTTMIGRVGADEAGTAYRRGLAERGVDVAEVTVAEDEPTGHALIAVDAHGENTIIVVPGANGTLTNVPAAAIQAADVLLVQLEVPLTTVAAAVSVAVAAGVRVVLNPSPWSTDLPAEVLAAADPVVVNEHEATLLADRPAGSVCVTLGRAGARWSGVAVPAPEVAVQDTTGAGDAFAGTLAAALAAGQNAEQALHTAVTAASEACTWPGAQNWSF
jgi:ribokinase